MTIILDTGALLALERGDPPMWRRLKSAAGAREPVVINGGVLAQAWRGGGGRQALLARALAGMKIVGIDAALGRRAGILLGASGTGDAIDASVVAMADPGARIVTSDPDDLQRLADVSGRDITIVPV